MVIIVPVVANILKVNDFTVFNNPDFYLMEDVATAGPHSCNQ